MSLDGSSTENKDNTANSPNSFRNILPKFILDGIRSELSVINTIPMKDIERIDVYKRGNGLIYGMGGGGITPGYTVTVEGISDDGLIIHQTGKIRIRK